MELAEIMVDRRAAVPQQLAAHVSACPWCAKEFRAMRASLEFMRAAPALKANPANTQQTLLHARQMRDQRTQREQRRMRWLQFSEGVACAAVLLLLAAGVFSIALQEAAPVKPPVAQPQVQAAVTDPGPTIESIRQAAAEVKTLSEAVRLASETPEDAHAREHRRALRAMDADVSAALTALERNPGCARAASIADANLKRQAQALRSLYLERTL